MKTLILLGMLLICFVAEGSDKNADAAYDAGFILRAYQEGYSYLLSINDEPVAWGHGHSVQVILGYPIVFGSNQVTVTAVFPKDYHGRIIHDGAIAFYAQVQRSGGWDTVDEVSEFGPFTEPYIWQVSFNVGLPPATTNRFEILPPQKDALVQECRGLAIKIISIIKNREWDRLARAFGLQDEASLFIKYPSPAYSESTNEMTVSAVEKEEDLEMLTGKCCMLVHSATHLISWVKKDNSIHMLVVMPAQPKVTEEAFMDCFVFARKNGEWEMMTSDGRWVQLNLSALLSTNKSQQAQ